MDTGERIKQIFTNCFHYEEYYYGKSKEHQCSRIFTMFQNYSGRSVPGTLYRVQYTVCPPYGAWILVFVQIGRSNDDYTAVSTPLQLKQFIRSSRGFKLTSMKMSVNIFKPQTEFRFRSAADPFLITILIGVNLRTLFGFIGLKMPVNYIGYGIF